MKMENAALEFESSAAGKSFTLAGINKDGGTVSKIFVGNNNPDHWVRNRFPHTEIVLDAHAIINDEEIDLVIIPQSEKQPVLVAEILNAGKNVRIL